MSFILRHNAGAGEGFWGLTDRQWTTSGLTLAEGVTLAQRLLASPLEPEGVWCLAEHAPAFEALAAGRCPVTVGSEAEMHRWAGFPFHRGVVAVARRPGPLTLGAFVSRPGTRRLVVAPGLTDPENLGSVFRSALALGWDAVAVGPGSCDPYSRRCAKVSMGAVYSHPPVVLEGDIDRLLTGWTNLALALEPGAADLEAWVVGEGRAALGGPVTLWLGNEFHGLAAEDRRHCSRALRVPMAEGHDSLNVAVAAGIGLYRLGPRVTDSQESS